MKFRERKVLEEIFECNNFIYSKMIPSNPADIMGLSYLRGAAFLSDKLNRKMKFILDIQKGSYRQMAFESDDDYDSSMFDIEEEIKEIYESLGEKLEQYNTRSEELRKRFDQNN